MAFTVLNQLPTLNLVTKTAASLQNCVQLCCLIKDNKKVLGYTNVDSAFLKEDL